MRVQRYTPAMKPEWDARVERSKNATFLLRRDYMDYHADRFIDHSLIITGDDGSIEALLPATERGGVLSSHAGLTYGGFIMDEHTTGDAPLRWLDAVKSYCRDMNFSEIIYKAIPHIYHSAPAEEDLYALFRNGAHVENRYLSTTIDLRHPLPSRRLDKSAKRCRERWGIEVKESDDANEFWHIITDNLMERHNAAPVHTADELNRLHALFPANIRFMTAAVDGLTVAASVFYISRRVIHLQYTSANSRGKEVSATDVIYRSVIESLGAEADYFDFGNSNEDGGRVLNAGLLHHKEMLGGRSTVYDTYRLPIL